MKKKPTTYGLHPEKVVELLSIGRDVSSDEENADQDKSDLLNEQLNQAIPTFIPDEAKDARNLSSLGHTIAILSGEPMGKLLKESKTDIILIKMIKDYARKLSGNTESQDEKYAYNTLYYAAIAHALVFQNQKITSSSYKELNYSFSHLKEDDWIPEDLLALFQKATDFCEAKMK